jgi:hypothetical protein
VADAEGKPVWTVGKPIPGRNRLKLHEADQKNTANVATLLARLSGQNLAQPMVQPRGAQAVPEATLARYGLHNPFLAIQVMLASREVFVVRVGRVKDQYYAYLPKARQMDPIFGGGDEEWQLRVWKMNKFVVDALVKNEAHFLKKVEKPGGEGEKKEGEGETKEGPGEKTPGGEKKEGAGEEKPGDGAGAKEEEEKPPGEDEGKEGEKAGEKPAEKNPEGSDDPAPPQEESAPEKGDGEPAGGEK